MAIHFKLIKSPASIKPKELRKRFGPKGGTIGRAAGNDWILADPDRFLSSRHCQITCKDGQYLLTDLSTNGTYINGASEPVGRGTAVPLVEGDSIDLGDYRFKVAIESDSGRETSSDAPLNGLGLIEVEEHPMDAAVLNRSELIRHSYADLIADMGKVDPGSVDPLVALGASGSADKADKADGRKPPQDPNDLLTRMGPPQSGSLPLVDALGDVPASDAPGVDQGDLNAAWSTGDVAAIADRKMSKATPGHADLLQASMQWPAAKSEKPVLPDDWDSDDLCVRQSPVSAETRFVQSAKKQSLPKDAPAKAAVSAENPSSVRSSKPALRAVAKSAGPAESERALADALGFKNVLMTDRQTRDLQQTVGLLLRECIGGLMQVLRSRASIKNEFRMNITTIQPVENNPIKFSANVDEVLETMFLRRGRAYKEPIDAVQEGFSAIADHQVAMIAGIRSAFRSALGKFDPLVLEEEFKRTAKWRWFSRRSYWKAYQQHYQNVLNDAERSFQELFGDEFVQAYEDQLRKLEDARKRKGTG